jgi:hypothetical protein
MPTSTIEIEDNIVDFQERRREKVIRSIIRMGGFPKEQIENIIKMHAFLTQIDHGTREGAMSDEQIKKIEEEVEVVREKFEELFEMVKSELFIRR